MKSLERFLPDEVDLDNPETWTLTNTGNFYRAIHSHFGNFCGDCEHLDENDVCQKKHRPRKYTLPIGPFEYVHLRMNCKDFELLNTEVDKDNIRRYIGRKLDWVVQQYG